MSTTLPGGAATAPTASAWKPVVQLPSSHYGAAYEDYDKWLCYYWQICNVMERDSRQVLEVGIGSQVVTSYLRRAGVALTTFDIDPDLRPDFIGSVTEMPFADGSFDAILCTEVLEHMPFDQTQRAMRELARCTRRYAYVAVPHFVLSFALLLRAPLLHLHELRMG
ncbi:MAG: class I SAM-dependent methyltransferase, partial [Streptosporangiaceae bacterium]